MAVNVSIIKVIFGLMKKGVCYPGHGFLSIGMTQVYGHDVMELSIMDWMVLHEAKVAMYVVGAFGETGVRGNGKVQVKSCHARRIFRKPSS